MAMFEEALDNLKLVLSSPRPRAQGTLISYTQTAKVFLLWLGKMMPPTDKDFRRYFVHRRSQGIKERTLTKEFVQLEKLAFANGWDWPFTKLDRPLSDEDAFQPSFSPDEIEVLIKARGEYDNQELFYLAISTTWGRRREEMVRIRKKDYNEESIKLNTAKQRTGKAVVEKLIPEEIKDILAQYHPNISGINTPSYIFYRIMDKSGLGQRKGWGWHAIRRALETGIQWKLAENQLPLSLVGDFMDWSKVRRSTAFGGAPMAGIYTHHEVMLNGAFAVDRIILPIHPFLPLWLS